MLGRNPNEVLRDLKYLEGFGLVEMDKKFEGAVIPHVDYESIMVEVQV